MRPAGKPGPVNRALLAIARDVADDRTLAGLICEAAGTGKPIFINDLRHDAELARWPIFTAAVLERTSVRTLCALPLQWGTINLGVLDLYRGTPSGLNDVERRDALAAADTATLMMLTLRTDGDYLAVDGARAGRDRSWLDSAVVNRAEIHQATGMVLAQLGLTSADALARMRAYAFSHDRLLIDVARDVVTRRLSFTDPEPS